jgi:hypothetical protein
MVIVLIILFYFFNNILDIYLFKLLKKIKIFLNTKTTKDNCGYDSVGRRVSCNFLEVYPCKIEKEGFFFAFILYFLMTWYINK